MTYKCDKTIRTPQPQPCGKQATVMNIVNTGSGIYLQTFCKTHHKEVIPRQRVAISDYFKRRKNEA